MTARRRGFTPWPWWTPALDADVEAVIAALEAQLAVLERLGALHPAAQLSGLIDTLHAARRRAPPV